MPERRWLWGRKRRLRKVLVDSRTGMAARAAAVSAAAAVLLIAAAVSASAAAGGGGGDGDGDGQALMAVKAGFGNAANALADWDGGRDHCAWRGVACDAASFAVVGLCVRSPRPLLLIIPCS